MRTRAQSHLDTVAGKAFPGMSKTAALTEKGDWSIGNPDSAPIEREDDRAQERFNSMQWPSD